MPIIINSNGKVAKVSSLERLFIDASAAQINRLYEELKNLEIKTANHAELDRLLGLYGFTRKNDLLVPITRRELPTHPPSDRLHQRFRINSSGKALTVPTGRVIGFAVSEDIGVGVFNPRAIAKLTKVSNE